MALAITVISILILGFAITIIVVPRQKRKAYLTAIEKQFGYPPITSNGLIAAENYWCSYSKFRHSVEDVDDITWYDIDMDSIFLRMNTCNSSFGDIKLYSVLRRPYHESSRICQRESLIESLKDQPEIRKSIQILLTELGRSGGFSLDIPIFYPDNLKLTNRKLLLALAIAPLIGLSLAILWPILGLLLTVLFCTINSVYFAYFKDKKQAGFIAIRYISAAVNTAKKISPLVRTISPELSDSLNKAARSFQSIGMSVGILNMNEFFSETLNLVDPLSFFLIPLLSYGNIVAKMHKHISMLEMLYNALGEIDLSTCILSYRNSLNYFCKPDLSRTNSLSFSEIYHPLVSNAVSNSASIKNGILLTGSNASGKSTFIKAIAVCCITGQATNTCTAKEFHMQRACIATSMAVEDNIIEGDSYFIAEIKSMLRLFKISSRVSYSYFFIDEILKGTNTIERIGAAAAVLRYLRSEKCMCFTASHDIELTSILASEYENYHFKEKVINGNVEFDYLLEEGPSESRNAILLLGSMGFPSETVLSAEKLVSRFELNGTWDSDNSNW